MGRWGGGEVGRWGGGEVGRWGGGEVGRWGGGEVGRWGGGEVGRWGGGEVGRWGVVYLNNMHYQRLVAKLEELGRILDQGYRQWMNANENYNLLADGYGGHY